MILISHHEQFDLAFSDNKNRLTIKSVYLNQSVIIRTSPNKPINSLFNTQLKMDGLNHLDEIEQLYFSRYIDNKFSDQKVLR